MQVQRQEALVKALFNEELGMLIQIRKDDTSAVMDILRAHGLGAHSHIVGQVINTEQAKAGFTVWQDGESQFKQPLAVLHAAWCETSFHIAQIA